MRSIEMTEKIIFSCIEIGDLKSAEKEAQNLQKLNKRIQEKDKILFKDIYVAYYQSCRGNVDISQIDELFTQLIKLEEQENINSTIEYWMLARCYINAGQQEKAEKLQKIAVSKIEMNSKASSSKDDQDAYYSNGLHQQIISPIEPYDQSSKKIKSESCQRCELELQPSFNFCPGCGAKI